MPLFLVEVRYEEITYSLKNFKIINTRGKFKYIFKKFQPIFGIYPLRPLEKLLIIKNTVVKLQ